MRTHDGQNCICMLLTEISVTDDNHSVAGEGLPSPPPFPPREIKHKLAKPETKNLVVSLQEGSNLIWTDGQKVNTILTWHRPEDGYRNVCRIIETSSTQGSANHRNPKWPVRDQVTVHLVFTAAKDFYIGY